MSWSVSVRVVSRSILPCKLCRHAWSWPHYLCAAALRPVWTQEWTEQLIADVKPHDVSWPRITGRTATCIRCAYVNRYPLAPRQAYQEQAVDPLSSRKSCRLTIRTEGRYSRIL